MILQLHLHDCMVKSPELQKKLTASEKKLVDNLKLSKTELENTQSAY